MRGPVSSHEKWKPVLKNFSKTWFEPDINEKYNFSFRKINQSDFVMLEKENQINLSVDISVLTIGLWKMAVTLHDDLRDIPSWLEENEQFFKPPVCNKMFYGDGQMKGQ